MNNKFFSALLMFGIAAMTAGCMATRDNHGSDPDNSLLDYTVSGFPVHTCILTDGDLQYVAYYDSTGQMKVAQRTLPDGPWKYRVLDEKIGWDSHNFITMIKDSRGVLHLSGNMHVHPLVYLCTDESGDISTFYRVKKLVGPDEDRVTYPRFLRYRNDSLVFHYRIGYSGNGNEIYDVMDAEGHWKRLLDKPLTDGEGKRNAYMTDLIPDKDGNYHLAWVWRETFDCSTNHDLSYAWSPNLTDWYAADGTKMTLPMKLSDKKLIIDPVPEKGGLINYNQRIGFDPLNRPVITYHKYDADGNLQIWVARFEDGNWHRSRITDWDWRWDFSGGGSIIGELLINKLELLDDGNFGLFYERYDPVAGKHWSKMILIDSDTLASIGEQDPEPEYPEWVTTPQSTFAQNMMVVIDTDCGDGGYILRKETLSHNRDRKREGALPPASELRVIKVNP